MFQLNKATEYAILLLINLTQRQDKPVSLRKIAQEKGLPMKYLEKIASRLKDKQLIFSKQGITGGYFLNKPASKISLIEIIKAVEEKQGLVSCIYGTCSMKDQCYHKKVWLKLQKILEKELKKIKLSDFS